MDRLRDSYTDVLRSAKPITRDEEQELGRRIKQGDRTALNKLVKANMRFVVRVAKNYEGQGLSLEELVSAGNIGLVKAAQRFGYEKNFKFISYAVWWIRQAIIVAMQDTHRVVSIPLSQAKHLRVVREMVKEGCSERDIMERFPRMLEVTAKGMMSMAMPIASLDAELNAKPGDYNAISLLDCLESDAPRPDEFLDKVELRQMAEYAMTNLGERDKKIVSMYFGLGNGEAKTYELIAKDLKLTRERVRQLLNRSKDIMRGTCAKQEFVKKRRPVLARSVGSGQEVAC
jgi:RNA polymerase primary sigma factor